MKLSSQNPSFFTTGESLRVTDGDGQLCEIITVQNKARDPIRKGWTSWHGQLQIIRRVQ